MVGYNVQSAVDTKHHLIVAHEVTNVGSDRSQLSRMSEQARAAIGSEVIEAVADRGYYSGEEIVACEQAGVNKRPRLTLRIASPEDVTFA